MRNLLEGFIGKEIDVHCGSASIRGKVLKVEGNVLFVEKDQVVCYINIEKIIAVWDSQGKKNSGPGFIVDRSGER